MGSLISCCQGRAWKGIWVECAVLNFSKENPACVSDFHTILARNNRCSHISPVYSVQTDNVYWLIWQWLLGLITKYIVASFLQTSAECVGITLFIPTYFQNGLCTKYKSVIIFYEQNICISKQFLATLTVQFWISLEIQQNNRVFKYTWKRVAYNWISFNIHTLDKSSSSVSNRCLLFCNIKHVRRRTWDQQWIV